MCFIVATYFFVNSLFTSHNKRTTGLNILDLLTSLQDIEDEDIEVQSEVFYSNMHADEDAILDAKPHGIDLQSHVDVFNAIFNMVGS